ncbi:unnamed protein product, partial [Staurois parvus]
MGPPTDPGPSVPNNKAFIMVSVVLPLNRGGLTTHGVPRAIGDHGAPVSLPKLKKAYEKSTRGILWGPLLTPGPRTVPEFPNGQSAP